jgi:hypothetical protein
VAVSSAGRVYVVWRRSNLDGDALLLSVSTDSGKTFSTPADVSTQTETIGGFPTQVHAFQPSIVTGRKGTVFISFLRENFTTAVIAGLPVGTIRRIDIAVIRSTDGGSTFSQVVVPTTYPPAFTGASVATGSPPVLALDSRSDNPYLAWAASLSGRTDIYMGRSRDGGATFDTAVNVTNLAFNYTPRQPSIALDPADVVYVAWNGVDLISGLGDNLLSVSTDGLTFKMVNNISHATYYSGAVTDWPAIRTDGSGDLIAVWREWVNAPYRMNDTQRDIFFARCSGLGSSCTTPINISTSLGDTLLSAGGGPIQPPGLTVDSSGTVYVFYDDDTGGSTQVMMWKDTSTANPGYSGGDIPAIRSSLGILNALNPSGGISPGNWVAIYGTNLAIGTCIFDKLPYPAQLKCSPTRVAVGSQDTSLYYVSPNQINAQIPSDLNPGSIDVTVFRGAVPSNSVTITLVP